jgi:hypothetical protein
MKRTYNFKDLQGQIFTRLRVIEFGGIIDKRTYWLCECQCGNRKLIRSEVLLRGETRSCGCLHKEQSPRNAKTIHGLRGTKFYFSWSSMKSRCLYPNNVSYPDYGGRGITVCERWLDFINFKEDMYESYLKHVEEFGEKNTSLDRFPNVNGNYEPGNVRWTTLKEQGRHRRDSAITDNYDEHICWRNRLSSAISKSLRINSKTSAFLTPYLGCTLPELRKHIESQFLPGMTWNCYGHGIGRWNLDHIIGCNNFDLSKEEDRKKCWNYKNLRPMWEKDHKNKSKKRLSPV